MTLRRTPLSRGTKTLKRTGFAKKTTGRLLKTPRRLKNALGHVKTPESISDDFTKKTLKKRKKTTPLAKLKKKLWELCREIQIKRYGSDCYTCRSKNLSGSSRHLGHFISSSICSTELRYSLDNLRVQCYSCNIHKSGNWLAYERHLIADGVDVEALKERNEQTKGGMYREEWYESKIAEYDQILASL